MEKGSSSSSSSSGGVVDPINGLKFGKKIYFEEAAAPPRSPAKKGRSAVVQGAQPPRCQVEGCKVDLSDAKAYYCRHKVCVMHSKSPKVIVGGVEQRFCQQCSRFHQLAEFDQGKRSCRRRLAGHNERRRKPPSRPLLSSPYATLSPSSFDNHSKTGALVMDFGAYSTFSERDSWANTSERGSAHQTGKYPLPWQSSPQTPPPDLLQSSVTRPSYSGPGSSSEDCFNGVSNSTTALSLLSNSNTFLGTNRPGLVQPSVGQSACLSWDFKGSRADTTLDEMPPDMGLAQIYHPSKSQYSRGLGLAREDDGQYHEIGPSAGYDSSVLHMNWSL